MTDGRLRFSFITLAQRTYAVVHSDISTLTCAYSDVYIANLPGKRTGDCRTKRVTTGAAEIETNKTSFSKSKRLAFLASFNPDNIAKVNEASAA